MKLIIMNHIHTNLLAENPRCHEIEHIIKLLFYYITVKL